MAIAIFLEYFRHRVVKVLRVQMPDGPMLRSPDALVLLLPFLLP